MYDIPRNGVPNLERHTILKLMHRRDENENLHFSLHIWGKINLDLVENQLVYFFIQKRMHSILLKKKTIEFVS